MGQLSLPSTTFPQLPGLPGPLPFSFSLLGHNGTEKIHSDLPTPQLGRGVIPCFPAGGLPPFLFLTKPSPPATAGPASLMPAKMQIPRGSREGSRAWLWHRKPGSPPRQREEGRLLHPLPQHDVGMVTPCPAYSIMGRHGQCKPCPARARRQQGQDPHPPPNPKPCPPTSPPVPHCLTCPPPREGERRWLVHPGGRPHRGHRRRLSSS